MASPLATLKNYDNTVINDFIIGGVNRNIDIFNENSGGAFRLQPITIAGDQLTDVFSKYMGAAMQDRDITSDSDTSFTEFTQIDINRIKKAKTFPISIQMSGLQWTKGQDGQVAVDAIMQALTESYSQAIIDAQINSLIAAAIGATKSGGDDTYLDSSATEELTSSSLQRVLSLLGDAQSRVKALVMTAGAWDKLKINALDNSADGFQSMEAWNGMFYKALGKVIVVTDNTLLTSTGVYGVLAVTENGLESGIVASNTIFREDASKINNAAQFKVDTDYGIGVKGCKFNPASAIQNPTDAEFATAANWDIQVDVKYAVGAFGEFCTSAITTSA